jgi:hypothetical protein
MYGAGKLSFLSLNFLTLTVATCITHPIPAIAIHGARTCALNVASILQDNRCFL